MKKFNPSKNIIIALVVVIIIVFLITFSSIGRDRAEDVGKTQSIINDVVVAVDRVISTPIRGIEKGVKSLNNLFNTYDENQRLKKRLDDFVALENENQIFRQENENLKEQLKLDKTISSYDRITGSVVSRSPDTWQDILIIDRGKTHGVKANMPVMGNKGLIGRVIVVNDFSSKVELLTSKNKNSNHFPVMIAPTEGEIAYGLLEGYDMEEEAFVVNQLTNLANLEEGDKVSTSGLGGSSPKGLLVGEVKKIKSSNFGLDREVFVTPISSMYDISTVIVIKRLVESDE